MLGACTMWRRCACRDCGPGPGDKRPDLRRQRARENRAWCRTSMRYAR